MGPADIASEGWQTVFSLLARQRAIEGADEMGPTAAGDELVAVTLDGASGLTVNFHGPAIDLRRMLAEPNAVRRVDFEKGVHDITAFAISNKDAQPPSVIGAQMNRTHWKAFMRRLPSWL